MGTYDPQYVPGLINRQLSLIVEQVERGILTHSQAMHTMALIQDGVSEALSNIRTHLEATTFTVEVVEHGKHHERCATVIDHTLKCTCDREKDWDNRLHGVYCIECNGKGRVWHPGCGDTDEPCMPCEGTGFNLDMRVY